MGENGSGSVPRACTLGAHAHWGRVGIRSRHIIYFTLLLPLPWQADVIAGLKAGEGEALARLDRDWQVNGKFGVIQADV